KNNAKSFGVDRGDVVMNYKFSNSSVAITRVADGKTDREVLHFRDLYKVKRTKKFFLLFVNKDEMYYVPAKPQDFVSGSADELFKLFYDNKVILDY
ncbi:MAG: YcxB family protein, partial [Clostridia bacterium]|nr:YcxB family protein [Clostridia bacterium]